MICYSNYLFVLLPSPFPFISCFSFFSLASGLFLIFNSVYTYFILSIFSSVLISLSWWMSYSLDSSESGYYSNSLSSGLKFSFILFILSEVFFFFSFFWSYFHFFLSPISDLNFSWPPYSVEMFYFIDIPLLNTFILLSSGISITVSHMFFYQGNVSQSLLFLSISWMLGLIFSYYQILEYSGSFFSINDSSFGCIFFLLTGFHGVHVLIGSFYLIFVNVRSLSFGNKFMSTSLSFELSTWYWHFVDIVWIILYFLVYVYSWN